MLKDAEDITDRVGGKIKQGMKGIKYVIEKNEGKCLICDGCRGTLIGSITSQTNGPAASLRY